MRSRQLEGCDPKSPRAAYYFPPYPPRTRQTHASSPSQNSFGVLSPPLTPKDPHHPNKTQSEHVESGPYGYHPQSTNDEARRGIMPTSSPSTRPALTFPTLASISNTKFTFRTSPRPEVPLSFPPRSPPSSRSRKRRRAVADVDGEHSCLPKKKRRLRLFLITSRLSPQFSHPATNIVDRGSSKIAVWAKQRALGRNILRKAAILNRIRRQSIYALETAGGLGRVLVEQEQLHLARLTLMYRSHDSATRPLSKDVGLPEVVETRLGEQINPGGSSPAISTSTPSPPLRALDTEDMSEYQSPNDAYAYSHAYPKSSRPSHLPLPPSPLGLSNYDAFDLEDDIPDPYAHLDEEYDADEQDEHIVKDEASSRPLFSRRSSAQASKTSAQQASSDFNVLNSDEPVMGDYNQVEEGADAIWPIIRQDYDGSSDAKPPRSSSEFAAVCADTSTDAIIQSPNPRSSSSPTSSSPNLAGLYVTSTPKEQSTTERQETVMDEDRERQRNLMAMSLRS